MKRFVLFLLSTATFLLVGCQPAAEDNPRILEFAEDCFAFGYKVDDPLVVESYADILSEQVLSKLQRELDTVWVKSYAMREPDGTWDYDLEVLDRVVSKASDKAETRYCIETTYNVVFADGPQLEVMDIRVSNGKIIYWGVMQYATVQPRSDYSSFH